MRFKKSVWLRMPIGVSPEFTNYNGIPQSKFFLLYERVIKKDNTL